MIENSRISLIQILIILAILLPSFLSLGQEKSGLTPEQILKIKAKQGEPQAQLEYGKFLLNQPRESQMREEAEVWINKAAAQNLPEAIFYLGYAGLRDRQENSPYQETSSYYERAARAGYHKAFQYVLDNFLFRAGVGADISKAKEFADLAREMNATSEIYAIDVVDICYQAGKPNIMYETGRYTGTGYVECEELRSNPEKHKECLFGNSDNIEVGELYANGTYVEQDFWKAISHICHGSNVPAELAHMVLTLHEAAEKGSLEEKFEYCDYATSSISMAICYRLRESKTFEDIRKKLDAISSKFSSDQRAAYKELEKIAIDFFDSRSRNEQDLSGSSREIFITEMELEQRKWFLGTIERLENSELKIPKSNFSEIKRKMQIVYENLLKTKKKDKNNDFSGAITGEAIEQIQKLFLTFRDSFAKFGVLRYSGTSLDNWRSWITEVRINQLKSL